MHVCLITNSEKIALEIGEPCAVKVARTVCAVRRVVISLLQAGGIEEIFLGYQSTWM